MFLISNEEFKSVKIKVDVFIDFWGNLYTF